MPESFLLLSIEKSLLLNILYAIIKAVGNDKKLTIPSKPSKFAAFNEYGGENMAEKIVLAGACRTEDRKSCV